MKGLKRIKVFDSRGKTTMSQTQRSSSLHHRNMAPAPLLMAAGNMPTTTRLSQLPDFRGSLRAVPQLSHFAGSPAFSGSQFAQRPSMELSVQSPQHFAPHPNTMFPSQAFPAQNTQKFSTMLQQSVFANQNQNFSQNQNFGQNVNPSFNGAAQGGFRPSMTATTQFDQNVINRIQMQGQNRPREQSMFIPNGGQSHFGGSSMAIQGRPSTRSLGPSQVVSENALPPRVLEMIQGQPSVVDVRVGESYEVSRQYVGEANVRVTENRLPATSQRASIVDKVVTKEVQVISQKAIISEKIVEKPIDVVIEKPVPVYREVPKMIDVLIEKPIEKIIEKEIITEIILEKPVIKVVEVPVDKVIEVAVERVIEQPVIVDRVVEIPREIFIDKPIERIIENPVFIDKVIEIDERDIGFYHADIVLPTEVKVIEQQGFGQNEFSQHLPNPNSLLSSYQPPIQKIRERQVEIPVEVVVQKPVPRMVDVPIERIVEKPFDVPNFIEKVVEVPVDKIVYNKVFQVVEEPEYITNLIERKIPVEKIVEVPYEVIEEVEVYRDVYALQPKVREVIKENVIRREIPKIIQQEVIYETLVPVEKVEIVEEIVEVPIDRVIERPIVKEVIKYVEIEVEKEDVHEEIHEEIRYEEKLVQVKVEKIIEVPVVKTNIIEKPLYIEKVIEREVVVPVEKIIEVPVEKIVEVPIEVIVEDPVIVQREVVREVFVDKMVAREGRESGKTFEDEHLRREVEMSSKRVSDSKMEVAKLKAEWESVNRRHVNTTLHANIDYTAQNRVLSTKIRELIDSIEDAKKGNVSKKSLFGDRSTNDSTAVRNMY